MEKRLLPSKKSFKISDLRLVSVFSSLIMIVVVVVGCLAVVVV